MKHITPTTKNMKPKTPNKLPVHNLLPPIARTVLARLQIYTKQIARTVLAMNALQANYNYGLTIYRQLQLLFTKYQKLKKAALFGGLSPPNIGQDYG